MSLKKITDADLAGKGVCGQADVPGLTAAEMQAKVEEIVRSVVIPAMNQNTEKIESDYATKEELGDVVLSSGAVTSVFGRAGAVAAQSGDYTADMVGAAAKNHAARHKTGGARTQSLNGKDVTIDVLDIIESSEFNKEYIVYTIDGLDQSNIFASILNEQETTYSLDTIESEEELNFVNSKIKEIVNSDGANNNVTEG